MTILKLLPQFISALLITLPTLSIAAECSAKSGAQTVPLLELYTSEGCSSCPPADKWLSSLKVDTSKIIPLAFHVDYWDYIGWKDRFSKAEYSERQRRIAAVTNASYVYTPQFVLSGRDFRGTDESRLNQAITANQNIPSRANLSLNTITQTNGDISLQAIAKIVNQADIEHAEIFVAIYENNLVSQVSAGENNGRELKHDYVVRHFFGAYLASNKNEFSKIFNLNAEWKGKQAGAVLFVQDNRNGDILQSLALPFCSS